MIARAWTSPDTLVGIIYADVGLHLPWLSEVRRTFCSRIHRSQDEAGRGDISRRIIVQTFTPIHIPPYVLEDVRIFEGFFFKDEIQFRKKSLHHPPPLIILQNWMFQRTSQQSRICDRTIAKIYKLKSVHLSSSSRACTSSISKKLRGRVSIPTHPARWKKTLHPLYKKILSWTSSQGWRKGVIIDVDPIQLL